MKTKAFILFAQKTTRDFLRMFSAVSDGENIRTVLTKPIEIENFPSKQEVFGGVKADVEFPTQFDVVVKNPQTKIGLTKESRILEFSKLDREAINAISASITELDKKLYTYYKVFLKKTPKEVETQKLPVNAKPSEYLNVRLTNGKDFYLALASGIGSIRIFQDEEGNAALGTIDGDGRLKVEVGDIRVFQDGEGNTALGMINDDDRLEVESVVSSGGSPVGAQNPLPVSPREFNTNDIEEASSTVTYIGAEDTVGTWYIKKIDTSSGNAFTHATEVNNDTIDNYTDAWTDRGSLTYGDYKDTF